MAVSRRADIRSGFDLDKPLYTISVASEILETHPRTREKGVNLAGVKHLLTLLEVIKKNDLDPPRDLRDIFQAYAELI
jgi:hypothetical protein